jgi:hypothetical protein
LAYIKNNIFFPHFGEGLDQLYYEIVETDYLLYLALISLPMGFKKLDR